MPSNVKSVKEKKEGKKEGIIVNSFNADLRK